MKKTITFKVKSNINHKYYYRKVPIDFTFDENSRKMEVDRYIRLCFFELLQKKVRNNIIDTVVNEDKMYKKYLKIVRKYCHKTVDKYFDNML